MLGVHKSMEPTAERLSVRIRSFLRRLISTVRWLKLLVEAVPQAYLSASSSKAFHRAMGQTLLFLIKLSKTSVPMSQQLNLEISDEVYADLQQKANAAGLSIAEWIVAVVSYQSSGVSKVLRSVEQQEEARQRFRNHAGAIRLGYAIGIDNESIDADLARAYASEYEG